MVLRAQNRQTGKVSTRLTASGVLSFWNAAGDDTASRLRPSIQIDAGDASIKTGDLWGGARPTTLVRAHDETRADLEEDVGRRTPAGSSRAASSL